MSKYRTVYCGNIDESYVGKAITKYMEVVKAYV